MISQRKFASLFYPIRLQIFEKLNLNTIFVREVMNNPDASRCFPNREDMYKYINDEFIQNDIFDYLEFGVFEGAAIKNWIELNKNPDSRFFGFDSFEGLPENWTKIHQKGSFDVGGELPDIDDPRVNFVKGWFQDTLPSFLDSYNAAEKIVIHNDSDLYSSTLYCLTKLDQLLKPGSIIIFDEFYDLIHEFKAFEEYKSAYRRKWRMVAHTKNFVQAAVVAI